MEDVEIQSENLFVATTNNYEIVIKGSVKNYYTLSCRFITEPHQEKTFRVTNM